MRINQLRMITTLNRIIKKGHAKITLSDIATIHQLIYSPINSAYAGIWRKSRVRVNGMIPPLSSTIPKHMNDFIKWLKTTKAHPLHVSAKAHLKLVDIHPFKDGNGRTARTLLAMMLLSNGYPIPTFSLQDRKQYGYVIHKALVTGDLTEYNKFIFRGILRSFKNIKGKF